MAYTDPTNVRTHLVKLRFNDREAELINAWANYTGQQKAVLLREMLLEQAQLDLDAMAGVNEGPQRALFGT
jgi:hypothetical protein